MTGETRAGRTEATFRYGAVLLLAVTLVIFEIAAPSGDWSRAVALALEATALFVVVATTRDPEAVRRRRAGGVAAVSILLVALVGFGVLPVGVSLVLMGLGVAAIPVALAGGLIRLIRGRGVNAQAVAGALAIYLMLGLVFAAVIGFVAHTGSTAYFTQGGDGTPGDRVYFSFTVLTTTGFGDFTAATGLGHALAVLEMLAGQLYLVTVIGILVGHMARAVSPGRPPGPR